MTVVYMLIGGPYKYKYIHVQHKPLPSGLNVGIAALSDTLARWSFPLPVVGDDDGLP